MSALIFPLSLRRRRLGPSNRPPDAEDRVNIQQEVQKLEHEFLRSTGLRYDPRRCSETQVIPEKARKTFNKLVLLYGQLSSVPSRLIPAEVWVQVFELVLHDLSNSNNARDLAIQRLSKVSRMWNSIVTAEPKFWTVFPLFSFKGKLNVPVRYSTGFMERRLEFYFTRSLSRPFSFSFSYHHGVGGVQDPAAVAVLKRLVTVSHRWETASFTLPVDMFYHLSPIRHNLHSLVTLHVSLRQAFTPKRRKQGYTDYFSDAPQLKHFEFDSPYIRRAFPEPYFQVDLPWAQLESYRGEVADIDMSYHEVLRNARGRVTRLVCRAREVLAVLSITTTGNPLVLPKLTSLRLQVDGADGPRTVFTHLDQLVLPALEELEIRACQIFADPSQYPYHRIRQLILRSGCSLKRLGLDKDLVAQSAQPSHLVKFLQLCPHLIHLDIAFGRPELEFLQLAFNPLLETLVLRSPRLWGTSLPLVSALTAMISSRTSDLSNFGGFGIRLKEVRVILCGDDRSDDYAGLFSPPIPLGEAAQQHSKTVQYLQDKSLPPCSPQDYLNVALHRDINSAMCTLEGLDLEDQEAHAVMVSPPISIAEPRHSNLRPPSQSQRGGIRLLNRIACLKNGVPGDRLYHFRERAGEVCEKWRPTLLRERLKCHHRWYFIDEQTFALRYVPPDRAIKGGN